MSANSSTPRANASRQHFERKTRSGIRLGADLIERLLKRETVKIDRAVGEQISEDSVRTFLTRRHLKFGTIFHPSVHANRIADRLGLNDQT